MSIKKKEAIYGKVYERTSGSTVLKYICEDDEVEKWQAWADEAGARRGTMEDALSLGDEEWPVARDMQEMEDESSVL